AHFTAQGRRTTRLQVSHAFHSPHMEDILDDFRASIGKLTFRPARIPVISNLTAQPVTGELTDPAYWARHVREAVRFHPGIQYLEAAGVTHFLELGPDATLTALTRQSLTTDAVAIPTLRKNTPETQSFTTALATLHTTGHTPTCYRPASPTPHADLPTYPFQRRHYWLAARRTAGGQSGTDHPLLSTAVRLAESDRLVLSGRFSTRTHPWLADHTIAGATLLPGTAFVDLALHAAELAGAATLEDLTLEAPLVLGGPGAVELQLTVEGPDDRGLRAFAVHSRTEDSAPWTRNATGALSDAVPGTDPDAGVLTAWPPAGTPVDLTDLYPRLAEHGYAYGPLFQGLVRAWRDGDTHYAEVRLPEGAATEGHALHPALLDAALHPWALASGALDADEDGSVLLPFSWSGVRLAALGARTLRVRLAPAGERTMRLDLADPEGAPVATVAALTARPGSLRDFAALAGPAARAAETAGTPLHLVEWKPLATAPLDPAACARGVHVLAPDGLGLADALGATVHADVAALRTALARESAPALVLAALTGESPADAELPDHARGLAERALALTQEWLAEGVPDDARLVLVTRGAVAARPGPEIRDLAASTVWGLVRTAHSEHPDRFGLLDLDGPLAEGPAGAVTAALLAGEEFQLAVRDGKVYAPRLVRAAAATELLTPPPGTEHWRLDVRSKGSLSDLALLPAPEAGAPLAPGEVRVRVRAAGLNFRDVLIGLGMYPGDEAQIGGEAAGVVLETGPGVTSVAVGDRVMGLFPSAVGPAAVTDHRWLTRMPRGWSFTDASVVPVVFLTAFYGLTDLARVREGESLLVHAATGGVGQAALQLARHWGLEVYGTASAPKWETLRSLGVPQERIASSRTLDFEEQYRAATGGRGFDVVLNSLAQEFVDASLRLLAPGGRFLEMGKTDIRDEAQVRERFPGVSYTAYDLMRVPRERVQEMLAELVALFEEGALRPLPVTAWDVSHAPEALRHLSQARHTGKALLTLPAPLDPEGTVLVTGGTGTLGGLLARHLVTRHGVRHLLLTSRRGPQAPGAAELLRELADLGARARIEACDTADEAALAALLASVPADHPLTAVVHTAGALDDAVLAAQSPGRLATALRPKADAAWNLHRLTRHLDLSAFVLYSSVSGLTGTPGQANYAAANAFLDALAHHRHTLGLPATSLAWGLWAQASTMTEGLGEADLARMARDGVLPLENEQGLALFDEALAGRQPLAVGLGLDLSALRRRAAAGASRPLFAELVGRAPTRRTAADGGGAAPDGARAVRERLVALDQAERQEELVDLVRGHVAVVLGHTDAGTIGTERPFKDLGFDSLTSVELRNRLATAFELRLPTTLVFDHPTPIDLARFLAQELAPAEEDGLASALADLERVERRLASLPAGGGDRHRLTGRVRELLLRLEAAEGGDGEGGDRGAQVQLGETSDDDLFDFIDRELGVN
ncbi:SDR family NAD(P)-dependent oxidoreductase, partial [Kitasatospora sp. NPDC001095]